MQPSLRWGPCDNVEVSIGVPIWIGDGGDAGPADDGNADTNIGILWRLTDQVDYWPALALSGSVRIPTGVRSNGVDGELRLVLTNEYDSGLRSHFNVYGRSVNTDNVEDAEDFQYGVVIGLDGPLCADGAVRWAADYTAQAGPVAGADDAHYFEMGWEWDVADAHKLGMSGQVNVHHDNEDSADYGARITYAYTVLR